MLWPLWLKKGFDDVLERMATKDDIKRLESRLDTIEDRLETIEKLVLANHKNRIEKLEAEIKYLKDALAV